MVINENGINIWFHCYSKTENKFRTIEDVTENISVWELADDDMNKTVTVYCDQMHCDCFVYFHRRNILTYLLTY